MGLPRLVGSLALLALVATPVLAQEDPQPDTESPDLWKVQKSTNTQYAELEKKLRSLAFILQRVQPKLATRLRRALNASEQGDVLETMQKAMDQLKSGDESSATVLQNEALDALEAVLEALETEDAEGDRLDPKRLEKLLKDLEKVKEKQEKHLEDTERTKELEREAKALEQAAAQVEALIEKQKGVVKETNEVETPEALEPVQKKQGDVAEATAGVAKGLGQGGQAGQPQPFPMAPGGQPQEGAKGEQSEAIKQAQKTLGEAQQAMEEAKAKMGEGQRDPAVERARAAQEKLQEAKAQLERRKKEVLRLAAQERRKAEQERTRAEAEELAKKMAGEQGGGQQGDGQQGGGKQGESQPRAPGTRNVEKAEEAMQRAGDNMANRHRDPEDVKQAQQEAMDQLEEAKQILEEALQQARRREQEAILKALGQRFVGMLAKQKELTKRTETLLPKSKLNRRDRREVRRIAGGERELGGEASDALELIVEEGSTAILPVIIEELVRDFASVARLLRDEQVNAFVVALQKDLEQSFEELIEVIKKEIQEKAGGGGGGGGGGGNNENGEPLLPATAELKMIKAQQMRVNKLTTRFDVERTAEADLTPEQQQACEHISDKQGRVAEFTRTLHERLNKER